MGQPVGNAVCYAGEQFVFSRSAACDRGQQTERMMRIVKGRFFTKNILCQLPEDMLIAVQKGAGLALGQLQPLLNADIEVFQHLLPDVLHLFADLLLQVLLELFKSCVDLRFGAAFLVDLPDSAFKIDGVRLAQHVVRRTEHVVEQMELVQKKVEYTDVGIVAPVDEIHNYDVAFLPVAVAASDPLLDPLGIPGQIVVYHQGAELQVQAFRGGLSGDHDLRSVLEILYDCRPLICSANAACLAGIGVLCHPGVVDGVRLGFVVGTVKRHDPAAIAVLIQVFFQVFLRSRGFSEDQRFALCPCFGQHSKRLFQRFQQRFGFGIVVDLQGCFDEAINGFDLCAEPLQIDRFVFQQVFLVVILLIEFRFILVHVVRQCQLFDSLVCQHLLQPGFDGGKRANQRIGGGCEDLADDHRGQHPLFLGYRINVLSAQEFRYVLI